MASYRKILVQEIENDGSLSIDQKIEKLREIESEARGLQRAASESPMNGSDGWENDLRVVRFALQHLGAEEPKKGAATL